MMRRLQHNMLRAVLVLALSLMGMMPYAAAWAQGAKTVTIEPKGNQLLFADTTFTVVAGQEVTIVFKNTATSAAMIHNVVVLDTMADGVIQRVGQAAIQASPDNEYVPDDPSILAYTPLAKPGETVEVTFYRARRARKVPLHLHLSWPLRHHAGHHDGRRSGSVAATPFVGDSPT